MTDKQINFEAIGHCTHLGARISQLLEYRTELYKELRNLSAAGMIPYNNAMSLKDIDLGGIDKPVELLKKINDTNQSIVNAAKAYNSWADKAGYEHYIISGGNNCNISVSVGFAAQVFNVSGVIVSGKIKATAESVLDSTKATVELIEKSQSEYEEIKQQLDKRFNETQSQITSTQLASASDIDMLSARISSLDSSIAEINSALATSVIALREEIAQVKANLR